jgi:hypothetical protein
VPQIVVDNRRCARAAETPQANETRRQPAETQEDPRREDERNEQRDRQLPLQRRSHSAKDERRHHAGGRPGQKGQVL